MGTKRKASQKLRSWQPVLDEGIRALGWIVCIIRRVLIDQNSSSSFNQFLLQIRQTRDHSSPA